MQRISLDRYVIQERANGVSIIHRDTGKEWRFDVDDADDSINDVVRRSESISTEELNEHTDTSDGVHGIDENDSLAGIADILTKIQEHSTKDSGVHGVGENDTIVTEDSISGKADNPHGNDQHIVDYAHDANLRSHNQSSGGVHGIAGSDEIATVRQVNQRADFPHGNEAHDHEFATMDDVEERAGGIHGNESHTDEYITGITALNDTSSLGTISTINFRDNFSIQTDGDELIIDSQGGVSSDDYTSHTSDTSAHHTRYTDDEARDAMSDITDGFVPSSGGMMSGPITQQHSSDIRTHEWTHLGNVQSADATEYLLIGEVGPGVRMVGSLIGVRGSSSNQSYAYMGIAFGSNTDTDPTAKGSITRLEAWDDGGPSFDFVIVEYDSTEYYALELSATDYVNYNQGIYFSGLTRSTNTDIVSETEVLSIQRPNIMNDTFDIGNEEVYHTGNVTPSEEGHDHSGETIAPQRIEPQEIQLPTYPSEQGEGSIWLVE